MDLGTPALAAVLEARLDLGTAEARPNLEVPVCLPFLVSIS